MAAADAEHDLKLGYQSIPGSGDRLLEAWDLSQPFYLNPLHGALRRRQGCHVFLLTPTPQDFNACSRSEDFFVLLGRIEDKQPNGVVTSS